MILRLSGRPKPVDHQYLQELGLPEPCPPEPTRTVIARFMRLLERVATVPSTGLEMKSGSTKPSRPVGRRIAP